MEAGGWRLEPNSSSLQPPAYFLQPEPMDPSAIFALTIIVMIAVSLIAFIRRQSLRVAIDFVAKRFGGVTTSGPFGLLGFPTAHFRYHESPVSLTVRRDLPRFDGRRTRLTFVWPDAAFRLELWTFSRRIRANVRDLVQFDSPSTERWLTIWTNNPTMCAGILSNPVLWQLEQLRQKARHHHLYMRIHHRRMTLSIGGHFFATEQLHDVIVSALQLYDQMQLTQQRAVDFVQPDAARVVDELQCPVCSSKARGPIVLCIRCKTPHCQECWQYNGKCATYGCGETRFVRF